jgi:hypothetical protein
MGQNELLFSKDIFPYEYFDTLDKFSETSLPPKDSFYSNLSVELITDEDYDKAQKVGILPNVKPSKTIMIST